MERGACSLFVLGSLSFRGFRSSIFMISSVKSSWHLLSGTDPTSTSAITTTPDFFFVIYTHNIILHKQREMFIFHCSLTILVSLKSRETLHTQGAVSLTCILANITNEFIIIFQHTLKETLHRSLFFNLLR